MTPIMSVHHQGVIHLFHDTRRFEAYTWLDISDHPMAGDSLGTMTEDPINKSHSSCNGIYPLRT
ncbi:MAG TPA: hypothetical protein VN372_06825 [Methanospirillum sp.]|nr:hypothetical protein [Methanospirillum sp.]